MLDCEQQILSTLKNTTSSSLVFLNVVVSCNASISLEKGNILINCEDLIKDKFFKIVSTLFPELEIDDWNNFLLIRGDIQAFLNKINYSHIFNLNSYTDASDKITIIKTIFLLSGHLYYNQDNSINSKGYNLEFSLKKENMLDVCNELLSSYGFNLKKIKRQTNYVLYTKNSNIISDLLVFLGASYASLEMQNNLAMRELRNNVNRQNNCFESNLDKTIKSSNLQLIAINYIIDNYSIDYLDDNLKEVALARIANPDVSLNDLKLILNNKLSRAGIKYRLDKIIDIYNKLKKN